MKKLKSIPKQPKTADTFNNELPKAFSIHLNGPFTDDDIEAVFNEQERLIEVMRWFQEFSVCHQLNRDFSDNCPLPHSVYGTILGLIANQLEQTTEVGRHLTRPSKMR